jgi:hypothetical protein
MAGADGGRSPANCIVRPPTMKLMVSV